MSVGFSVEIDPRSLASLKGKLAPDLYREAVSTALIDLTHHAEGVAKGITPVVSGHLARSEVSDVSGAARWPGPTTTLATDTVYAEWIETGTDSRGRQMQTRPGGYRMFEAAEKSAEAEAQGALDKAASEVERRWAS